VPPKIRQKDRLASEVVPWTTTNRRRTGEAVSGQGAVGVAPRRRHRTGARRSASEGMGASNAWTYDEPSNPSQVILHGLNGGAILPFDVPFSPRPRSWPRAR
jgi:hypothetical protein